MFPHFTDSAKIVTATAGQWSQEFLAFQPGLSPCAAKIREAWEAGRRRRQGEGQERLQDQAAPFSQSILKCLFLNLFDKHLFLVFTS